MENLLLGIAEYGIVSTILIAIIFYFLKRERIKDREISNLHEQLRMSERDNLTALMQITAYLEKREEIGDIHSQSLNNDLREIKDYLKSLMEKL